MGKFTFQQKLVLGTAAAVLAIIGGLAYWQSIKVPDPIEIDTTGQPTIGNPEAKVEVVVFEDFLCTTCRLFNEDIFPKIQSRYIASGKILYTFVPLAFIDGSKPIGNAALEVYKIAPTRFFAYVHELFEQFRYVVEEGMEKRLLLELAKKVGGIDLEKLEACIESNCNYAELERNFYWARELMGADFGTPAVFVDGVKMPPTNYRKIETQINKALYFAEEENRLR